MMESKTFNFHMPRITNKFEAYLFWLSVSHTIIGEFKKQGLWNEMPEEEPKETPKQRFEKLYGNKSL